MLIDSIIVGIVVAGAAAYLVWALIPRRRASAACGACARSTESRPAVAPVRTRWTG